MRFAHLADTHLGYRQYNLDEREEDFYRAFNEAVDKILMHKCDFVVHSGDLFDEPRPHVRAMVEVRKALEKLHDNHIPFFAIPGNHDILMRRGAVIPHAIYRKMHILTDKNPWREHKGIFICGLQYHSRIHSGALRDRLKELGREAEKHEKRILLLHQGIERYIPLEYELKFSDIPNFDYYALGHVHKRILDGKLAYPGATEMWRMDEIEDYEKNGKGFYIVDTDNFSVEKVELEGIRPFMRFEVDASCDIEKIKKKIAGGRPVLNITVASEIHEYQQLHSMLVKELSEALYLDIKRRRTEEETPVTGTVDIKALMNEAMREYTGEEREYAYLLFRALSKRDMDEAREITEDFYKIYLRGKPHTAVKENQRSLEAFK